MPDKILISNNDALSAKYGAAGVQAILAAIAKLVAVDQGRGLQTVYVAVNDPGDINAAGGAVVTHPADPQQNKNAVDSLYSFHKPEYVVLDSYSKLRDDAEFRKQVANKVGLGFEIPSERAVVGPNGQKIEVGIVEQLAVNC